MLWDYAPSRPEVTICICNENETSLTPTLSTRNNKEAQIFFSPPSCNAGTRIHLGIYVYTSHPDEITRSNIYDVKLDCAVMHWVCLWNS